MPLQHRLNQKGAGVVYDSPPCVKVSAHTLRSFHSCQVCIWMFSPALPAAAWPAAEVAPPHVWQPAHLTPLLRSRWAMAAIVKAIAGLPLRLVRRPVSFVVVLVGITRRRSLSLPVAGLCESKAQPIWFLLSRAATTPEVGPTASTHVLQEMFASQSPGQPHCHPRTD